MNNLSFWEYDTWLKNIDVLIIGGGIVGLNTAISLKEKDPALNIILIERGTFPSGATTKNAGFACYGSTGELLDNIKTYGEEALLSLVKKRRSGIQKLTSRLTAFQTSYLEHGSFEVFTDEESYQTSMDQLHYLNHLLTPVFGAAPFSVADEKIPYFGFRGVKHIIQHAFEGSLHSGQLVWALQQLCMQCGIKILTGVAIQKVSAGISPQVYTTNGATIQAKKIIVCTNAFAKELLPHLDIVPGRGQVWVTEPIADLAFSGVFHADDGFTYFRNIGNRILLGGGRNKDMNGETTTDFGSNEKVETWLNYMLHEIIYPAKKVKVDFRWSGIMAFGHEKKPIVERAGDNVYCAVRMGGMGVAIGAHVAEEVAELVLS